MLGIEVATLIEDPEATTIRQIASEARKMLSITARPAAAAAASASAGSLIVPFPVGVKMRLFCLPYAGGVSENVFAKCVPF
jgi:hypothetical protein